MQKKILLSLLAAAPAAMPAFADINYGSGTWTGNGVDGKLDTSTPGSVTGNLNTGAATWMVNLVPGTYQLSFETTKNLEVSVTRNGAIIPFEDDQTGQFGATTGKVTLTFVVDGTTEQTVTIIAKNGTAAEFGFTGADLNLVFDFEAVNKKYQALLDDIKIKFVKDATIVATLKDELDKEGNGLQEDIAALKKEINENIVEPKADDADALKAFKAYYMAQELFYPSVAPEPAEGETKEPVSKLADRIAALEAKVKDYNDRVAAADADYDNKLANEGNMKQLVDGVTTGEGDSAVVTVYGSKILLANINKLIADIAAGSDYAKKGNAEDADALLGTINAYNKAIETAYATMTADPKKIKIKVTVVEKDKDGKDKEVEKELTVEEAKAYAAGLNNQIDEIRGNWQVAQNDAEAYATIMNVWVVKLQNATNTANNKINSVHGITPKTGPYYNIFDDTLKKDKLAEVAALSNGAKDALNLDQIKGAYKIVHGYTNEDGEVVPPCEDIVKAAVDQITNVAQDFYNDINKQNTIMNTAQNKLKALNTEFGKYTGKEDLINDKDLKKKYEAAVNKVNAALGGTATDKDGLVDYINKKYAAAELNITTDTDYTAKVAAVETAIKDLKDFVEPFQFIFDLDTAFNNAKKTIDALGNQPGVSYFLPGNGTNSGLYGLYNKSNGTFASIAESIAKLTTDNVDDNKDNISKAIQNAIDSATKLAGALNDLNTYSGQYSKDVNGLKAWILSDELVELTDKGVAGGEVAKNAFINDDPAAVAFFKQFEDFKELVEGLRPDAGQEVTMTPNEIYTQATGIAEKIVEVDKEDGTVTKLWEPEVAKLKAAAALAVVEANNVVLNGDASATPAVEGLLAKALENAKGDYKGNNDLKYVIDEITTGEGETEVTQKVTITFDDVKAAAGEIGSAITAAGNETATGEKGNEDYVSAEENQIAAYADVTNQIIYIISGINGLNDVVKTYKQYQANYDALNKLITGTPAEGDTPAVIGINGLLSDLAAYNTANNTAPATDYFNEYIIGNKTMTKGLYKSSKSLPKLLTEIQNAMTTALNAYADPEKALTDKNKGNLEARLADLKDKIAATEQDIVANKKANGSQVARGEGVAAKITAALASLETYRENAGLSETNTTYVDLKNQLSALINTECVNASVTVANYFGLGQSDSKSAEIEAKYAEIEEKLNNIKLSMGGTMDEAIQDLNKVVTKDWEKLQGQVNSAFTTATTEYNKYYYGLTNPGWRAYVLENTQLTQIGAQIYAQSEEIDSTVAAVNALIKEYNGYTKEDGTVVAPKVLTSDKFTTDAVDKINDLIKVLNGKVGEVVDLMNKAAVDYYEGTSDFNGLHAQAVKTVGDEKEALTNATLLTTNEDGEYVGVPEFVVANNALIYAEKAYAAACNADAEAVSDDEGDGGDDTEKPVTTTPLDPANVAAVGYSMNRIADLLDMANTQLDLQGIAMTTWGKVYGESLEEANGYVSALLADPQPATSVYKNASKEMREAAAAAINKLISNSKAGETRGLKQLNSAVLKDKNLIKNYKADKKELDDLMAAITAEQAKVKKVSDDNKAAEELLGTLTTDIKDYEKDYATLLEYAYTLAGGEGYVTTGDGADLRGLIDQLQAIIDKGAGELIGNETNIEWLQNSIEKKLSDGFNSIGQAEIDALNQLLLKVKAEYNNVRSAYYGVDENGEPFDGTVIESLKGEDGLTALGDWITSINDDEKSIGTLEDSLKDPKKFNKDTFKVNAQKLESSLGNLYSTLTQSWKGKVNNDGIDPLPGIVEILNSQYTPLNEAIEAVNALLAQYESIDTTSFTEDELKAYEAAKTVAKDGLTAASTSLNGMHDEWNAKEDGKYSSRVLTMQGTYEAAMNQIAQDVKGINNALTDAKDDAVQIANAIAANEAAYKKLSGELEGYEAQLNALLEDATEAEENRYQKNIIILQNRIKDAGKSLSTEYKNRKLNKKSVLTYTNGDAVASTIQDDLTNIETNIYRDRENTAHSNAYYAIRSAKLKLQDNNIANRQELLNALQTIQDEFEDILKIEREEDQSYKDYYQGVIVKFNKIVEDADNLVIKITDNTYQPGNVDRDADGVTSTDVMQIITWVLEKVTYADLLNDPEYGAPVACAADLNGDGKLNTTDAVMAINIMLNGGQSASKSVAARKLERFNAPAVQQSVGMGLMLVEEKDGARRYAITLDNTVPMIAGQFDLKLPAGMRITDISVAERNSNHSVEYKENADGARVVVYSMDNAEFDATSGAVLYINVEGKGNLKVENAEVTDTYFNTHILGAQGSSLVDSIIDGAKEVKSRIYNAAGMMFDKLQNGINIIRDSNGKVKKQYNRK